MSAPSKKPYGLILLVMGAVVLVVGANLWKTGLKVRRIVVEGNRIVGTNEILQLVQVQPGSLLFDADLNSIQHNVLSHYYVKEAAVGRDLPSTIHVQIVERVPVALVNRAESLYLDEEGFVLPHTLSKALFDLPVISGISVGVSLEVGKEVEQPDVLEALVILSTLRSVNKAQYHRISEVQVRNGGDIVMFAAEGGVPIIVGREEIATKLARLEKFWSEIVRDRGAQNLQYVDLRYDDQIVVRWKSQTQAAKAL